MQLSNYKAFLFDVDKTLTNLQKEISPRTKLALKLLQQKGYIIGVCSGRHFATLHETLEKLFLGSALHIHAGGAQVIRTSGEVVWEQLIPAEVVQKIVEIAQQDNARIVIQQGKNIFGNDKGMALKDHYALPGNTAVDVLPLTSITDWKAPIMVVSELTDAFTQKLSTLPISFKVMKSYSGSLYTDITAKDVTKAFGLKEWCRMTGIPPEKIIGFGDSENDTEFLSVVGYAVAMGNAIDAVKAVADEVTGDCDHDGVAEWIEKNVQ